MPALEKDDIATPSEAWRLMEKHRALPRDLQGGVLHIQQCAQANLWRAKREKTHDYQRRLDALVLDPYYWSACEHLGSQPFTQPAKFSESAPPLLLEWMKDVDGTKRSFEQVARQVCTQSVGYGLQFLFVTWDPLKNRPFIRALPAESVLDPHEPGAPLRLSFEIEERVPGEPWKRRCKDQIWLLWEGDLTVKEGEDQYAYYEIYEREEPYDSDSDWNDTPTKSGSFSPLQQIPLVPVYTGTGSPKDVLPWVCLPPLHPLALMNRSHMNKRSDLDFGLNIANIPQRAAKGITEDEVKKQNTVSYKGLWWTENPQGEFYFVEHGGISFEISMKDLDLLERRMEVFGLSPMLSSEHSSAPATATGRSIDLSRATVTAEAWAIGWTDSWLQAAQMAAKYGRLPVNFELQFVSDFAPEQADLERAKIIQTDYIQGDLDPLDYFNEMKALGIYGESFDPAAAAGRVAKRRDDMMKQAAKIPVPAGKEGGAPAPAGPPAA